MKFYKRQNIVFIFIASFFIFLLMDVCLGPNFCWADIFNVFNDAGIPHQSVLWTWQGGAGSFNTISDQEAPERVSCIQTISGNWAGWGIFFDVQDGGQPCPLNFSNYSQGQLRFFVKTPVNLKVELKETGPNGPVRTRYIANYGWNGLNEWQEITIPISAFNANLTQIYSPFMITAECAATFYVDYVRWEIPISGYTPTQVAVNGRQLLVNGSAFTVRGVSAEFTPVGEIGSGYDWSLYPENYTPDMPLIDSMRANVVRTYHKRPTQRAFLDSLNQQGIYLIMGFPVDAVYGQNQIVDFGNPVVRQNIKRCFLDMVGHWKNHPAILMWCLGNEVNRILEDNGVSPNDWYSLVDECAEEAHLLEGANYHPVTTANADQEVWDIGDPTINADDVSLPHLDLWSLQLYRGESFGDTFSDYQTLSNKPLLISEFGCDVYDGRSGQENQPMQLSYLTSQWTEISANLSTNFTPGVCIGGIMFSWRDGWWKSSHGTPSSHDTETDWLNPAYDDMNMNEEWWGVVAISQNQQDRTIRQGYNLWLIPAINITYPHEGGTVNTFAPTITWQTTNIEPNESLRIVIGHPNYTRPISCNFSVKNVLLALANFFDIESAYADSRMVALWSEDLNVVVPNTGSYTVPQGIRPILYPNVTHTLTISKVTEPNVRSVVHFRVSTDVNRFNRAELMGNVRFKEINKLKTDNTKLEPLRKLPTSK
ncbi:MAG: glycoside hydrolase family 2 TIM barrel-domain containing protein [Candidatus Omnitrophica bacterium]|nr:glycoside hydrolase family 2 TIM barrel-domain containing protein [Candidatus Omnitrophota bacterium]MDD5352939.1 glycoside hydrolase family 2 TIM barrel-domain containing protein [Candidatus Omnitrophota bacterium]MDD5550538.1 glycoside hydrolase family 2 TIM barrel-domain containing protein [Candidatus Omnitrophota bacterium]